MSTSRSCTTALRSRRSSSSRISDSARKAKAARSFASGDHDRRRTTGEHARRGTLYAGAGVFHILEAARQIRGDAAETQVDADLALAHGVGGVLSTNATLLMEAW